MKEWGIEGVGRWAKGVTSGAVGVARQCTLVSSGSRNHQGPHPPRYMFRARRYS
jgi:hypothetical protein